MADAFVQVEPDSTGKSIQTYENTVGGVVVEAQAVVPVNSSGSPIAPALEGGNLATLAGAVTSGKVQANVATLAGVAPSLNAGNTDTGTVRVVTATDGPLNTNLGLTTHTAIITDADGSISGKLRGLVKMFADVWDATNHWLLVKVSASKTGGWTPYYYLSAAAANQDSIVVNNGGTQLGYVYATNINAAARYLKIYDKGTAPTSSDTPVFVALLPGATTGAGGAIGIPVGATFTTGLSFRITTGAAVADTGSATAAENIINLGFKS